jgi:hypothetical protein
MIQEIDDAWIPKIVLNKPLSIQGSYMIKCYLDTKPIYLHLPQCKLKAGIQKSGKKFYCDLMFSFKNDLFINWMELLEDYCKKTIFKNRFWFDTELDEDEIDNFFVSTLKSFKSGKFSVMRTRVPEDLTIFDETGEKKISLSDVGDSVDVLAIIEIVGIKCLEKNFQIETEVKQMLLIQPLFEKCIIKTPFAKASDSETKTPEIKTLETKNPESIVPLTTIDSSFNSLSIPRENVEINNTEILLENPPFPKELEKNVEDNKPPVNESISLDELIVTDEEPMKLKTRDDIYQKLYKDAKDKAKTIKRLALMAYLEAKRIKNEYMIDDVNESDNEEDFYTIENT